jgi:hypothetical protein
MPHNLHDDVFMTVKYINVSKIDGEDFLYYVKAKEDPFDIRQLKNWGYDPSSKISKDPELHRNVIKEGIYHGWLDDYLIHNEIQPIYT